jgi:hypothetical protein
MYQSHLDYAEGLLAGDEREGTILHKICMAMSVTVKVATVASSVVQMTETHADLQRSPASAHRVL